MATEFCNDFITFMNDYDKNDDLKQILLNPNDVLFFIKNFDNYNMIYKLNYINIMTKFIRVLIHYEQIIFFKEFLFDLLNKRNIKDIAKDLLWKESYEEPTSNQMYVNHVLHLCPNYKSFRSFFSYISEDDWNKSIHRVETDTHI